MGPRASEDQLPLLELEPQVLICPTHSLVAVPAIQSLIQCFLAFLL